AWNGKTGTSKETSISYWEHKMVDVPDADTLNLLLQVSNFTHSKGGVKKPIISGDKDTINLARSQTEAVDLLLTGCLFMGGLFFLGLYIFGSRDRATLLFSLFCILYSYR